MHQNPHRIIKAPTLLGSLSAGRRRWSCANKIADTVVTLCVYICVKDMFLRGQPSGGVMGGKLDQSLQAAVQEFTHNWTTEAALPQASKHTAGALFIPWMTLRPGPSSTGQQWKACALAFDMVGGCWCVTCRYSFYCTGTEQHAYMHSANTRRPAGDLSPAPGCRCQPLLRGAASEKSHVAVPSVFFTP